MGDKPEYRWLVAQTWADGRMRKSVILHNKELAVNLADDWTSREVPGYPVKAYLIDLHELTPVAVTGSAG